MVEAYILKSSSGKTVLVIESIEPYYIRKIVKKLQKLREKDLKKLFEELEVHIE